MQHDYTPVQHDIFRILAEATDALYSSDIAERLNRELPSNATCSSIAVFELMQTMQDKIVQLSDGRWMLKRKVV